MYCQARADLYCQAGFVLLGRKMYYQAGRFTARQEDVLPDRLIKPSMQTDCQTARCAARQTNMQPVSLFQTAGRTVQFRTETFSINVFAKP